MPLKPGGDRVQIGYTVKKTTAEKIRKLAEQNYRPMGKMLDIIVEAYDPKDDK